MKTGRPDARQELRTWYTAGLRPKLLRAAGAGKIDRRAAAALDADLRALLALDLDRRKQAA